jgi:hypothetical protein
MPLPTNKNSVKNLYPDVVVDDITIVDFWRSWQISKDFKNSIKNFDTLKLSENDRWDTLAEALYGDRKLWWILVLFNEIEDPFRIYYDKTISSRVEYIRAIKIEDVGEIINTIRQKRISLEQ